MTGPLPARAKAEPAVAAEASFWHSARMHWPWLGLLALTACAANPVEQTRLKDGSIEVKCELALDECLRRVQTQCPHMRYRILGGTSETRLRDASPFERAYHSSRLHLICSDDGATVLVSPGAPSPAPSQDATSVAATPKARSCSAGETRVCVGAGACQGGQACLPDGSGFGSCDCGSSAAAPSLVQPAAPSAPSSSDASPALPSPAP